MSLAVKDLGMLLGLLDEKGKIESVVLSFYRSFGKAEHFQAGCALSVMVTENAIKVRLGARSRQRVRGPRGLQEGSRGSMRLRAFGSVCLRCVMGLECVFVEGGGVRVRVVCGLRGRPCAHPNAFEHNTHVPAA